MAHVKDEEVYLKAYASAREARMELEAYFRFYNDQRDRIRPWAAGRWPRYSPWRLTMGKRGTPRKSVFAGHGASIIGRSSGTLA